MHHYMYKIFCIPAPSLVWPVYMTAQLDSFPNLSSLKFVCNREHTTCAPRSIVESLWDRAWRGGKEQKNIQTLDSKGKHTHTWQLPLSPFVSVRTLLSRLPERHRTNRWPCWQHLPTWRGSDEGCQYKFWDYSSSHYEHLRRPRLKGEKDKVNILRRIKDISNVCKNRYLTFVHLCFPHHAVDLLLGESALVISDGEAVTFFSCHV